MTPWWRKQLAKIADLIMTVPCGNIDAWTEAHHEPLIVGFVFHFVRYRPWQLRDTPLLHAVGGKLRTLWKETPPDARTLLQQLFLFTRTIQTVQESLVWKLLSSTDPGVLSYRRTTRRGRLRLGKEG